MWDPHDEIRGLTTRRQRPFSSLHTHALRKGPMGTQAEGGYLSTSQELDFLQEPNL